MIIFMNDRTTLIDKMREEILAYGSCAQFEAVQAAYTMHQSGSTETRGPEMRDLRSAEDLRPGPDHLLSELDADTIDAFIVLEG